MNSPRRRAREVAMKALYQAEMAQITFNAALNQVLSESVYSPVFDAVARDFLKSSKADEILSGEVEAFVPDFSDSLSSYPMEPLSETVPQVKACLEKYFPGYTYKPEAAAEISGLCEKVQEKRKKNLPIEEFARQIIERIEEHGKSIDNMLEKTAENWSIERMASVDRCILRIAISELFYFPEIPANASINEAIELAKKYSADRSYEFVNGILDKICKENKLNKSASLPPGRKKQAEHLVEQDRS